jgi:hypothetical protein
MKSLLPVALFMALAVHMMGCSRTPDTAKNSLELAGQPHSLPASDPHHAYTIEEMAALYEPPKSASDLLKNLSLAWKWKLLLQPAFFEDTNLKRFFGATTIVWEPPDIPPRPGFSARFGTLTIDNRVFSNIRVRLRHSREIAKEVRLSSQNADQAAYVENTGQIEMSVEGIPEFTWGEVKKWFGSDASDIGAGVISEQLPQGPLPEEFVAKAFMRYTYPGQDTSIITPPDLSGAWFVLIQGPVVRDRSGFIIQGAVDSDIVRNVRIYEVVKIK